MGLQRVWHDWATKHSTTHIFIKSEILSQIQQNSGQQIFIELLLCATYYSKAMTLFWSYIFPSLCLLPLFSYIEHALDFLLKDCMRLFYFLIHFSPSHIVFQITLLSTFALVMLCARCCLAGVSKIIRSSVWWYLHWGVVSAGKWIYL